MSDHTHNAESEAFLTDLKKELIQHLAHKMSFTTLIPENAIELKLAITKATEAYLSEEGIALKDEVRNNLIEQLVSRITTSSAPQQVKSDGPTQVIHSEMASYLAQFLSEDLTGQALADEIATLVERKCETDRQDIEEAHRKEIVREMCRRMNVAPPSTYASPVKGDSLEEPDLDSLTKKEPAELPADVSDQEEPIPAPAQEPHPVPQVRARGGEIHSPSSKSAPASFVPLKALTHDIKRELLFELGQKINVELLSKGDLEASHAHINELIDAYCQEHRLTLTDDEVAKIIEEILSGEGLEFQL